MCESLANSPGTRAMKTLSIHKDLVFKKPMGTAKKKKKIVLNDESYVEEIGKIIQRDFFPDLEKLKAQNEYLDAMERNDTIRMRELYQKYSGNRPPTTRIPSPATFETPADIHNSQIPEDISFVQGDSSINNYCEKTKEMRLSLDQYLNSHTSEDNESFEELVVESDKKHKEKYAYLYKDEKAIEQQQLQLLALPSIEDQAKPLEKMLNVGTWGYKNRNHAMFNPDGVPLTSEEELELSKKKKEIDHSNTRLIVNPFNEIRSKETINDLAKTQAKVLDGKIGVDGKEILKPDTPKVAGFSFVRSPSPSPSLMGSPLMTWGEIEGTPFRLDGSDTPLPKGQGPSFKISEPPRREQLALELAEKAGEKSRNQKKRNIDAQRKQLTSPSPRTNTSVNDRLATMSPAAKKLAVLGLKMGATSDIRSIYSPSPLSRWKSPNVRTPRRPTTPLVNLKPKITTEVSTDDLLKISLPKRQRAQDFF